MLSMGGEDNKYLVYLREEEKITFCKIMHDDKDTKKIWTQKLK